MAINEVTALIPLDDEDELEDMEDMPLMEEDEDEEMEEISFPIPTGFAPPDSAVDGGLFDAHITARIQDGMIIIDSINNSKLGASSEKPPASFDEELAQGMAASGIGMAR